MQKSTHPRSVTIRLYAIAALVAAIAFFVDWWTKQLARGFNTGTGPFPHILTLVHHYNEGLVANLPVPLWAITVLTLLVLALVLWMLRGAVRHGNMLGAGALGLLVGGALGNFVDRLTLGSVFDWILLFGRSAMNLADLWIFIGALLFVMGTRKSSTRITMSVS